MKKINRKPEIGVVGIWHLGAIYATSLAKLGFRVTGFDLDDKVISDLNTGKPPIYEPYLTETLKKHLGKNLFFSKNPEDAMSNKEYIFVTLDMLIDSNDQINLAPLNKIFDLLVKSISSGTKVVISSQIPIGTSRTLLQKFKGNQMKVEVIYFPENLKLGQGFKTFLNPDRIILGSNNKESVNKFTRDFPNFKCKILGMSLESAEMVKHALNTFLAVNISFASEIADLCELTGADMQDVMAALKTDKRISPYAPINPGLGFAGGTLGRDLQSLAKISKKYDYNLKMIKAAYRVNSDRINHFLTQVKNILSSLSDRNIGFLGLTYKPHTNTLRRSQTLQIAQVLHQKGCNIRAYDPIITKLDSTFSFIKINNNSDEFFKNLDMAILMTEWPQFKKINPKIIFPLMKTKLIFDTKNFLQESKYISSGFKFFKIGEKI